MHRKDELISSRRSRKTRRCHLQIVPIVNLQLAKWKTHMLLVRRFSPLVDFSATKLEKWRGKARTALFDQTASALLRPPWEWTDYHRLSGRKQSCGDQSHDPLRLGLPMQIKLSFLSNASQRKPIAKAAVWRRSTVRLNATKWFNHKRGNGSSFKGHLIKMMLFMK